MTLQYEDTNSSYLYDGVVDFKDGKWDISASRSFDAPFVRHKIQYDGPIETRTIPYKELAEGGDRAWSSTVRLIEADTTPALQILLDPPKIYLDSTGALASCTLVLGAANTQSALAPDGWALEFDFGSWFDPKTIKTLDLEDESIASEGRSIVKYFYGRLRKKLSPARVSCNVHIKDPYITTGFSFSVSFMALATVRAMFMRPSL